MPTLFSYRLRYDLGSAPNPFWGTCTLAICKPRIRQRARVGDWVVGTGSAESPLPNNRTSVVYAMRVTDKKTMEEYDQFTQAHLPRKMPQPSSKDHRRRRGDSIYDFTVNPPVQRPGVHDEYNRKTDMSGEYVLLSNHFFYFGNHPVEIPETLQTIIKQGPGHKSNFPPETVEAFIEWMEGLGYPPGTLLGKPQLWQGEEEDASSSARCGPRDRKEAEEDLDEPDDLDKPDGPSCTPS